MPKNKVSEWSSTPSNNTDIGGINIAEGCAPSGINNAIRELMAQVKDMQTGSDSDNLVVGGGLTVSGSTVLSGTVVASGAATFSSNVVLSGNVTMSGTTNIGATTTSSTIISGTATLTTDAKLYLDDAATTASAPALSWDGDTNTGIYRPAADTIALVTGGTDRVRVSSNGAVIIGSGEATTSVSGNILRAPSASGSDITGANFEINSGNGTGTGGSGSIIFKTAPAGSSSSSPNTMTQRLLITKNGGFSFGSGATDYGTAGQVLKSNGDAPPSFGSPATFGTAKNYNWNGSTTNKYIDFENIPSTAKKITVMLSGVSTDGSSGMTIQLGTSGGIVTTGYTGASDGMGSAVSPHNYSLGFDLEDTNGSAAYVRHIVGTLVNISGNTWLFAFSGGITSSLICIGGGSITLAGALTTIRFTTRTGNDNFDAGTFNICYE